MNFNNSRKDGKFGIGLVDSMWSNISTNQNDHLIFSYVLIGELYCKVCEY